MKEKSTVGFPFFGEFSSDCIVKATKYVNRHFFIQNFTISRMKQFL